MGNQTRSPATMIVVSLVLLLDSCTGGGGGCTWTMSAGNRISTTIKRMMIANIKFSPKSKVMIVLWFNWLLFMCTAQSSNSFEKFLCLHTVVYMLFRSLLYSLSRRRLVVLLVIINNKNSKDSNATSGLSDDWSFSHLTVRMLRWKHVHGALTFQRSVTTSCIG